MPAENAVELKWILAVVRRWLWLIVACTLVAGAGAYVVESCMPLQYAAVTTLMIDPSEQTAASEYNDLVAGERLALTYSKLLNGWTVLEAVIDRLGLTESPDDLAKNVYVESVSGTQLIRLTVTDESPTRAAVLANTITEVFSTQIRQLQASRYEGSLADKTGKANDLATLGEETHSKIDRLLTTKLEEQKELLRLADRLAAQRENYATLQQSYREMQLTATRLGNTMRIIQPARVLDAAAGAPYTATVTLFVDKVPIAGQADYLTVLTGEGLAATYEQLLAVGPALEEAIAETGVKVSLEELTVRVGVQGIRGTQLIRLGVADADAGRAIALADAIARRFVEQVTALLQQPNDSRLSALQVQLADLSTQIAETQAQVEELTITRTQTEDELARLQNLLAEQHGDARAAERELEQLRLAILDTADTIAVAEPAQTPETPIQPALSITVLAMLVGALVASAVAFLAEHMNESLRTPEDVQQILGLNTLATIDRLNRKNSLLIRSGESGTHAAEAFMALATSIRSGETPFRTILVTSSAPAEGKSLVTANLAIAMARMGQKVVAIDADLRRPGLHRLFGLSPDDGLADALRTGGGEAHLQLTEVEGLRVLSAGEAPVDPVAALSSPNLAKLVAELKQEADVVLIDSPSVLGLADVRILARLADGALLVVHAGHTSSRDARSAVDLLRQAGAQMIGAVLNAVPGRRSAYYRYYRHSGKTAAARADADTRIPAPDTELLQQEWPGTLAHG
jgi:capsular exopolysaccharide synthesis family protein